MRDAYPVKGTGVGERKPTPIMQKNLLVTGFEPATSAFRQYRNYGNCNTSATR